MPGVNILGARDVGFYYFVIALAVVLCIASRNLFRTRVGRAFIALREEVLQLIHSTLPEHEEAA